MNCKLFPLWSGVREEKALLLIKTNVSAVCILILFPFLFFSCKKKSTQSPSSTPSVLAHGLLVLNEGLFNQNNSTLSFVDTQTNGVSSTFFEDKTGRGLGDTGNDMERYGNKIYVVVNVSSTIEILDATTGNSLKQILMFAGSVPKQPRSIAFSGNKAFVTCYDGFVDVIDTNSLTITTRIQVGSNPEGLAVSNGKVYVANSGGLNYPNVDSTVSVIDIASLQEIKKITIGNNPGSVCVDSQGDVYAISRGNYGSIPSRMHRIDPQTDIKVESFPFEASGMTRMNDQLLISYYDFSSGNSAIALFDSNLEQIINPNFISTDIIQTLYGVHYSSISNKIYCMDAKGFSVTGYIYIYSSSGIFFGMHHVGLNPSKVIVYE